MTRHVFVAAAIVLTVCGCSRSDPEPTAAEALAAIEGRELTDAEVTKRQQSAELLCGLSDEVLVQIWKDLAKDDFAFQDFVFNSVCQERSELYIKATGRTLSDDADSDS